MSTSSIVKGTALLAGAGLIVKIMGAGYRIFLARLIGNEGIGLYQMAYPIYLVFLSLSTAGVPIAISRVVAEKLAIGDRAGTRKVLSASLMLLLGLGVTGALSMAGAARWIAGSVVADPRAVFGIWALAPAIFFMSLMAALRGFFQGWQEMGPSAVSQIIEQSVRVGVALILSVMLLRYGVEYAAAGAAFGATMGGMAGLTFLLWFFWRKRRQLRGRSAGTSRESIRAILIRLIRFTLPISLAVILTPLLQTIDSIIVPAKLQSIGYSIRQATSMLGILGNSWAVVYLPLIITAAISSNLVPSISGLQTRGLQRLVCGKINEGLRLAIIYLIPASVMLLVYGRSIYRALYGDPGVELLCWFAPAIIFLGLEQVSAGTLQGLGKPSLPLVNFISGALVKIIVTLATTSWPGLNLAGAALGTVAGSGTTALLNLIAVQRLTGAEFPLKIGTLAGGTVMLAVCWYLQRGLAWNFVAELMAGALLGGLAYLAVLWMLGGIDGRDLEMITSFLRKKEAPG